MSNKKISALDPAAALTGAEIVPVVQSAGNVRTTTADIAALSGPGGLDLQLQYNANGSFAGMSGTSWNNANSQLTVDGKYQVKNGATSVFESNTSSFTGGNYIRWISTDFFISFFDTYAHAQSVATEFRGTFIDSTKVSTQGHFGFSASGSDAFSPDTFLTRKGAAHLQFGRADNSAPVAQTIGPQSVVAGTSNTAGQVLTYRDSAGTGSGASGGHLFQTAPAGGSGTAQNAYVDAVKIESPGNIRLVIAFTVATLPAAGTVGRMARITDGDAGLAWGATAVNSGSGATPYLVWDNGAAWTIVGK